MGMPQPFRNPKKKVALFLHYTKATLLTNTDNNALRGEESHGNDIAKVNSPGIHINGDVITLCKQSRLKEALHILHLMDRPHSSTYASFLQACIEKKALPQGKLVHAHIIYTGFEWQDIVLGNTLMIMYTKCGSMMNARIVLDKMPNRNVVSWTVMIAAYAKCGYAEEALMLFYQMQRTGIRPNHFTFTSMLTAIANLGALEHGKKVHEKIIRNGFQSNVFVGTALVDMYIKCETIDDARKVFDKMPERDVVLWTAMVAGYAQNGCFDEALEFFQKVPDRDVVSWNAMIAGYMQNGQVDEALKLFQEMPERNLVTWNAIVAGYARNGHVDEALKMFRKMPKRDVVSWNGMLTGYVQNGYFDESLKLFRQMKLAGVKPDSDTFASVLPVCANLAAMQRGKEVHIDIIKGGFQSDVYIGSALVDMYAKCGSIKDARNVFDEMSKRDVVSWNTIIVGYAMHGHGKEALQLFERMQCSHTNPDHVTFVGVLTACCHTGLVDDGWRYFNQMGQYHIIPAVEHYCCMVDLLGRAGHLDEAQDFIKKMPIKPDAAVWGSLLAACRMHTNVELGECVAECLFELEPKNPAPYVLLSNIYAAADRWNDVEKVRKMLKDRRVKKMPGCSWITFSNNVCTFLVGDKSHLQVQKGYAELERLSGHMKETGYVSGTKKILHDV
eukprot:Gb_41537 [translate_table: standard]